MSETLHVALCVDANFVLPLAVALASLDGVQAGSPTHVHMVGAGIGEHARARVTAGLRNLEVSWIEAEPARIADAYYTDFLVPATLYRLILADLLPTQVERAVYLDADILVLRPITELGSIDLRGQPVGAVRDSANPWAAGPWGAPWAQLGMDPGSPYFNAGVLVIDLPRWRAGEVGARSLDLLRRTRPRWGDQDGLNTVLEGHWQELPRRWNLQTAELTQESAGWALWRTEIEAAIADPAVVHFTGMTKPWQFGSSHPATANWLEWVDRTAWAGWRPQPPQSGRLDQLARLAVGSARAWRARQAPPVLPH